MYERINDVELEVAVGIDTNSGCVTKIVSPVDNLHLNIDIKEYGGYLWDLFREDQSDVPDKPGVYSFKGYAMVSWSGDGDVSYHGDFTKIR